MRYRITAIGIIVTIPATTVRGGLGPRGCELDVFAERRAEEGSRDHSHRDVQDDRSRDPDRREPKMSVEHDQLHAYHLRRHGSNRTEGVALIRGRAVSAWMRRSSAAAHEE
jgi:hypothetical protein